MITMNSLASISEAFQGATTSAVVYTQESANRRAL
jgi:hypothetical protein